MRHCNEKHKCLSDNKTEFYQTHSLNNGLRVLGDKGKKAYYQEMNQIHKRDTFEAFRKQDLTETELKRVSESLTFLEEKRDGRIKGRACTVGSTQKGNISKEVVEAKEERCVKMLDVLNAFYQAQCAAKEEE